MGCSNVCKCITRNSTRICSIHNNAVNSIIGIWCNTECLIRTVIDNCRTWCNCSVRSLRYRNAVRLYLIHTSYRMKCIDIRKRITCNCTCIYTINEYTINVITRRWSYRESLICTMSNRSCSGCNCSIRTLYHNYRMCT